MTNLGLICCAAHATDEILQPLGFSRVALVEKTSNPLTPAGFDALVVDLLVEIQKVAYGPEKKALDAALKKLDRNWKTMTPADRSDAIRDAAQTFLGLTEDVAPEVAGALKNRGVDIVTATKAASASAYKLRVEPIFDGVDQRILDAAAQHQALFIRDQYGVRAQALSQTARSIVAKGLEEGLDRYAIADELAATLNQTNAARSNAHWNVIASVFAGRSRSWGTLSSFREAGITKMQVHAVLDEVTTEVCRFLNGKTFSVDDGISRFEQVAAESDPEAVKELQPWGYTAKDEAGNLALFYKQGGERKPIARVDSPAVGKLDAVGSYSNAMSEAQLAAAGFHSPPYHGGCRTNLLPIFESIQVPAIAPPFGQQPPSASAGGTKPARAPKPPKEPKAPKAPPPREDPIPPPKWSVDRSKPGFDVVPALVRGDFSLTIDGSNVDDWIGKKTKDALIDLFRARPEDVAKTIGTMGGEADKDPDFDRNGYEEAIKKVVPNWKKIQKHASENAEIGYFRESNLPKLLHGNKIDVDKVAVQLVGGHSISFAPSNKEETSRLPIVFRYKGKLVVEAGAESIIAAQARAKDVGGIGVYLRVIDLDKALPKPKFDDAERVRISKRVGEAFKKVAALPAGTEAPIEIQHEAREAIRDLLRTEGIETRDDYARRSSSKKNHDIEPDIAEGSRKFRTVDRSAMLKDADAYHKWTGDVVMLHESVLHPDKALEKLARDPSAYVKDHVQAEEDFKHLIVAVHEEIHGASRARSNSYQKQGIGIEEAATEVLARRVMRKLVNAPKAFPLPNSIKRYSGGWGYAADYNGAYNTFIAALIGNTAQAIGPDDIELKVEEALLKTRVWDGTGDAWPKPEDQMGAYVDALGIKDKGVRKALLGALMADPDLK